jgi:hypothetical protein
MFSIAFMREIVEASYQALLLSISFEPSSFEDE